MFTGLIEETGEILEIKRGALSARMKIAAHKVLEDVKVGDSICVNGICLTVTEFDASSFSVDVMPETIRASSLKEAGSNTKVNLERAMAMNGRFGGHIVAGHIDGTGKVISKNREENAVRIKIRADRPLLKYIINKGSIALDGVSLTVASLGADWFEVSIIPLTAEDTNLLDKRVGDPINIECDQVGKYIERLMEFKDDSVMDLDYLSKNGF
ncbi:riboflavin synthase [Alkalibacter saccharofermentans]|uniref:Riboflavin synthase n=1 Tax=Alkalibacter saccharofermentans DSM 14828 TaxID=1120975 RepID=A0A1M4Y0Q9_9FIRM|nr:riboflavin synthase [Alkalibacter saccharofermentans]SHE99285.1 riboflavin synthase alpha chain [Alkalibacter saccharofermentans DSM 14828]